MDDLVSNWAYMVMASLGWSLKAWSALLVPVAPRHRAQHEAERRTLLRTIAVSTSRKGRV